jgi:diacylglycerol O-acyltransferase
MKRLTGLDAGFLYMETPTLHMHTLKIAVIDPSTSPGGYTFERLQEEIAQRLHLLPALRRRIVEVPGGIHHPLWIEDPDFDLGRHLHRRRLEPPGSTRQMDRAIAEIADHPLDRSRPLWEMWALEGLEGGLVAFVTKIHHAVADGVAAAAMLANVMVTEPTAPVRPPEEPWTSEQPPSRGTLLRTALVDRIRQLRVLPALVVRTIRALAAVARHRRKASVSPPLPFATPRTRFNRALISARSFATATLALSRIRAVKDAFGVTVNDVVLAVTAGALRAFLSARGELPERSLVAGVPVSTGTPGEARRLSGNRVSNLITSLCTDVADPVERLRAIHDVTKAAKGVHTLLGPEMLGDWVEFTPPRPYAAIVRLYSKLRIGSRVPPPLNLVVSNVPGPTEPLYVAGARLANIYSVGPILEGIGLNLTAWSYLGQMNFGAIASPDALSDEDLHEITERLDDALAELEKRAPARA